MTDQATSKVLYRQFYKPPCDTSGPLRMVQLSDGWYVAGHNNLVAVDSYQDGVEYIDQHNEKESIYG